MRATGSPARTVSPWDTATSRTWTYATWISVGSPSTTCRNRMALEGSRAADAGERAFGMDLEAEDDSVEGCQKWLPPAVPVLVAGSVSRVQRCQVSVRSAVPPHHDAVGGERVGYVVLHLRPIVGGVTSRGRLSSKHYLMSCRLYSKAWKSCPRSPPRPRRAPYLPVP